MAFPEEIRKRRTAPLREEYETTAEWGRDCALWMKSRSLPPEPERVRVERVEVPVEVEKIVVKKVYVHNRSEADEVEPLPISDAFRQMMNEGETVEEAGHRMWRRLERLNALVADEDANHDEMMEQTALHQIQYELSRFQSVEG